MLAESCEKPADAVFFRVPVAQPAAFMRRDGKLRTRIATLYGAGQP